MCGEMFVVGAFRCRLFWFITFLVHSMGVRSDRAAKTVEVRAQSLPQTDGSTGGRFGTLIALLSA